MSRFNRPRQRWSGRISSPLPGNATVLFQGPRSFANLRPCRPVAQTPPGEMARTHNQNVCEPRCSFRPPDPPPNVHRAAIRAWAGITLRRERLDHVVAFGEQRLRQLLGSRQRYYNDARTPLSLNKDAPASPAVQALGRIVAVPHFGSLHHQ